jgi:hypothetical protein
MNQVLVCLKNRNTYNIGVLDKKQKELVELGNTIRKGKTESIAHHVKSALDAGATNDDILTVASFILGDKKILNSIIELIMALSFEESKRRDYISVVEDCRES